MIKNHSDTSWEKVSNWYNDVIEKSYYHKNVLFPNLLRLIFPSKQKLSLLDLGCGEGALGRILPKETHYVGIDISPSLIGIAKKKNKNPHHSFYIKDITQPFSLPEESFDYVLVLLALQGIQNPQRVIENAWKYLKERGTLLLVLNHPCFRIPRQSGWEIDRKKNIQYRKILSYLSFLDIPITIHPSKKNKSPSIYAFHRPLSYWFSILNKQNFLVHNIEEWISPKKSMGRVAKIENRARKEIPLFLTMIAKKISN